MKKTFREVTVILVASVVIGIIANAVSSKGVPFIRDDSERFAVDTSTVNIEEIKIKRGKLNKAGYYNPVNIPVEAAKMLYDEGVLFVDGRDAAEFQAGHITGALNIDYKTFKDMTVEEKKQVMKDIKTEQLIVSYCGSDSCEISIDNAYEMAKAGYNDVKIFLGGYKEWNNLGYPVVK
ncbi:MAG TPA: rhodanese-like domain-containing protein [Ignavibacteria bacterium]|nr:rhodanese-like domain-containing protein [Ignavibacteria bacterium]HMR41701.1 rhodanese-like domain-containing protein [Ignavibacteria bacterium]